MSDFFMKIPKEFLNPEVMIKNDTVITPVCQCHTVYVNVPRNVTKKKPFKIVWME